MLGRQQQIIDIEQRTYARLAQVAFSDKKWTEKGEGKMLCRLHHWTPCDSDFD